MSENADRERLVYNPNVERRKQLGWVEIEGRPSKYHDHTWMRLPAAIFEEQEAARARGAVVGANSNPRVNHQRLIDHARGRVQAERAKRAADKGASK